MPVGWSFTGSSVQNNVAKLWLSSTVAGQNAVQAQLTPTCDPRDRAGGGAGSRRGRRARLRGARQPRPVPRDAVRRVRRRLRHATATPSPPTCPRRCPCRPTTPSRSCPGPTSCARSRTASGGRSAAPTLPRARAGHERRPQAARRTTAAPSGGPSCCSPRAPRRCSSWGSIPTELAPLTTVRFVGRFDLTVDHAMDDIRIAAPHVALPRPQRHRQRVGHDPGQGRRRRSTCCSAGTGRGASRSR